LRGSSFAEKRVIDLLNTRFVTFYFCFREGRTGYDADAAKIYNEALKDDADFQSGLPPVVIFTPGGDKALKQIPRTVHFEKDKFFDALRESLRANPVYDTPGANEKKLLAEAAASPRDAAAQYQAGRAREMAAGADASSLFEKAIAASPESEWAARSNLRLATLARHDRAWDKAEKLLAAVAEPGLADDVGMERAHKLLTDKNHAKALELLDATIRAHPSSNRMGELRFYAGVANFHSDRRNWANYHWWWVLDNLPDDHHVIRCSVALTAPANCFANPELGGYAGKAEMTINEGIDCRTNARIDYEYLKDKYGK